MTASWLGAMGLGLALVTAAPPRVQLSQTVCAAPGACMTLLEEERTPDGVRVLRLEEKLPRRLAPDAGFGLWLAWPLDAERLRPRVYRSTETRSGEVTPVGRFELLAPALTQVRRTPREPPALLVHVRFDPREQAPLKAALPEAVAAAQARGLLNAEQERALAQRQQALEARLPRLVEALNAFRARPADPQARDAFLSTLLSFPGEEGDAGARAVAPETFLTAAQRTALRKEGYAVEGRRWLEYPGTPGLAYRLNIEACSVEQLVREWNAGLRGPASGIEELPRPGLEVERARRHDDVSFTLDVLNEDGRTRMAQVLQRLLAVPGVRPAPGPPLPPPH